GEGTVERTLRAPATSCLLLSRCVSPFSGNRIEARPARDRSFRARSGQAAANRIFTLGTPTRSIHHCALATSGGPSCGHSEQYGSTPVGSGWLSRLAWMIQLSSTYRIACQVSRGDLSTCAW